MASLQKPADIGNIRASFPPKPLSIEGRPMLFSLVYTIRNMV